MEQITRKSLLAFLILAFPMTFGMTSCQQDTKIQGGIVDNGNKPGGGSTSNPQPSNSPVGEKIDSSNFSQGFYAAPILGGRHTLTKVPKSLTLALISSTETALYGNANQEAQMSFVLNNGINACQGEFLKFLPYGGTLSVCGAFEGSAAYEVSATNGDIIYIKNYALDKDTAYDIIDSIRTGN